MDRRNLLRAAVVGGASVAFGFTSRIGDNRVWLFNATNNTYELVYDDNPTPNPPFTGVDHITGAASGDLYVAEDGGSSSEICGPAF